MLFKNVLTCGVAFAAVVSLAADASAGHRTWRNCWTGSSFQQQGPVYRYSSPTRYYAPGQATTIQGAPIVSSSGPPVPGTAAGVTRRFSYEPGAEGAAGAPVVTTPAPVQSAPAYRPAPAVRSQSAPSSSPPRNPVERRLRPGGGWQR